MASPCPRCGHTGHVEDQSVGPDLGSHILHRCAACDLMFPAGPELPGPVAPIIPGPGDLSSVRLRMGDGYECSGARALWLFELGHTTGHDTHQVVPYHRDHRDALAALDAALTDLVRVGIHRERLAQGLEVDP